ncbi:MAG: hypothetical protein AAF986_11610 [Pseudomonadota bacterium]
MGKNFDRKAAQENDLTDNERTALALSSFSFNAIQGRLEDVTPATIKQMTNACGRLSECRRTSCSVGEAKKRDGVMQAWRNEVDGFVQEQRVHLKSAQRLLNKAGFDAESAQRLGLQMSNRLADLEDLLTAHGQANRQ